ncbi:MAG: retropepsin-like domain-containing protein [Deltaproteobacteria bacterium]|nr:retropepsin-like domain-containing protein [Deltaproteobacteria bacterium]
MRLVTALLVVAGLVPGVVALAALIGLGVVRGLPAFQVGLSAALLLVLPVGGLYLLFGRRELSLAAATWTWPLALLAGLPGYFPGEVNGAMASGFAVLAAAGGPEATRHAARLAESIPTGTEGASPPPAAEKALPDCTPVDLPLAEDQVALPYEGLGHSMTVPIQFGEHELPMLFDTGASVTTLGRASLREIGLAIPGDAPEITLRTANGERTARLVLVDRLWVGGFAVDGVTVGVCEECADDDTAGLLGLNVSGQFLVTVDTVRKEVLFQARRGRQDRVVDVAPWLKVRATARLFPDGRVEVEATGENSAPRAVSEAEVGIHCGADSFVARLANIAAGERGRATLSLPRGTECDEYRVTLESAYW